MNGVYGALTQPGLSIAASSLPYFSGSASAASQMAAILSTVRGGMPAKAPILSRVAPTACGKFPLPVAATPRPDAGPSRSLGSAWLVR